MKNKWIRRGIRLVKSRFEHIDKESEEKLKKIEAEFPHVLSTSETLKAIIEHHITISRFGDAEFDICNQENLKDPYQRPNDKLSKRLKEILLVREDGFLACIPPFNAPNNNIKNYYGRLSFWELYWLQKYEKIGPLFSNQAYGNSFVSRDSVFYENQIDYITKIWKNRKVVFIYGKGGRFKEDSILFREVNKAGTIFAPPTNAFDEYNRLLEESCMFPKDVLFLIAAASVLAYDLFKRGYQAVDVGHIPNCYDQYKGKIISPETLPMDNR